MDVTNFALPPTTTITAITDSNGEFVVVHEFDPSELMMGIATCTLITNDGFALRDLESREIDIDLSEVPDTEWDQWNFYWASLGFSPAWYFEYIHYRGYSDSENTDEITTKEQLMAKLKEIAKSDGDGDAKKEKIETDLLPNIIAPDPPKSGIVFKPWDPDDHDGNTIKGPTAIYIGAPRPHNEGTEDEEDWTTRTPILFVMPDGTLHSGTKEENTFDNPENENELLINGTGLDDLGDDSDDG